MAPPGPQGLWLYPSSFTTPVCLLLEQNPLNAFSSMLARGMGIGMGMEMGGSSHTLIHPLLQSVMGRAGWLGWR